MQATTTVADAQQDDPALTAADLISAYEKGVEELRLAVAGMTDEQLRSRPVAGKWSTLEALGVHVVPRSAGRLSCCGVEGASRSAANRLNVSITRARCKTVVCLPRPLLEGLPQVLQSEETAAGLALMQNVARAAEVQSPPLVIPIIEGIARSDRRGRTSLSYRRCEV